jgi:hypothetical protein
VRLAIATAETEGTEETCDPIQLEILVGALRSSIVEMGALLERTAMSAMIREKKDYLVAFFDPQARMVAGTVLPLFGPIVQPVLEHYPLEDMRPGDIYWFNDCYGTHGAVTHSPDQARHTGSSRTSTSRSPLKCGWTKVSRPLQAVPRLLPASRLHFSNRDEECSDRDVRRRDFQEARASVTSRARKSIS